MKVRNGFVSNSSSSSFLIRMESKNIEEFSKVLFGEDSKLKISFSEWCMCKDHIRKVTNVESSEYLITKKEISKGGKYEKDFNSGKLYIFNVGNEVGMDYKISDDLEDILLAHYNEGGSRVLEYENNH